MVPGSLIPSLAVAADAAVNRVLLTGAVHAGQSVPTGEVGFVAAVVIGGVPALAAAWNPILRPAGYSVQLTGVFCHQSPMVDFVDVIGRPQRCELADLMVVVDDQTGPSVGSRWAVLVQAKMAAARGGKALTTPGDLVQLELLSRWPSFSLPPTFTSRPRDFSTCLHRGVVLDCGRYGLIDPQPKPAWRQQSPAPTMPAGGPELGSFLAHMVETGQSNYGREATGTADDWSFTVNELLTASVTSFFVHSAGFGRKQPRNVTAIAFAGTNSVGDPDRLLLRGDGPPPPGAPPRRLRGDLGSEGISILHIAVRRAVPN